MSKPLIVLFFLPDENIYVCGHDDGSFSFIPQQELQALQKAHGSGGMTVQKIDPSLSWAEIDLHPPVPPDRDLFETVIPREYEYHNYIMTLGYALKSQRWLVGPLAKVE